MPGLLLFEESPGPESFNDLLVHIKQMIRGELFQILINGIIPDPGEIIVLILLRIKKAYQLIIISSLGSNVFLDDIRS